MNNAFALTCQSPISDEKATYTMQPKTRLTIGSADTADVQLRQPTISQKHCELDWSQGAWHITDCDSTNGTFINGQKVSQRTRLIDSDRVTLGRGVALSIPAPPQEPIPIVATPPSSRTVASPTSLFVIATVAGSLGVLCVATIGIFLFGWVARVPPAPPISSTVQPLNAEQITNGETPSMRAADVMAVPKNKDATAALATKVGPVWAIVVETADQSQRVLLGTAVAIEPNRLIALASVVDAAHGVREQYPRVGIVSPASSAELIPVRSHGLHPEYQAALAELTTFRQELQSKLDTLADLEKPTLDESLAWSQRLDQIMSKLRVNDLAYLIVETSLESIATTIVPPSKESIDCRLHGFPTLDTVPVLANDLEKYQLDIQGRWLVAEPGDVNPSNAEIEYTSFSSLVKPTSLACLDRQDNLVGLCGASESNSTAGDIDRVPVIPFAKFWATK
ncbi:MAG: FHA domain-containing protein [Pirellulaceae bacterium]